MAAPWASDPVIEQSATTPWEKDPVAGAPPSPGPGRGGMKPSTTTAQPPEPTTPMGRFANGVDQMTNFGGNRPNQKLAGAHNAFVGASELAAPMAIPALVAAPAATIGAGLLGGVGKLIGNGAAQYFHASPEVSDVIGDAASVPSAMLGSVSGESAGPAIGRFLSRGIPPWASDVVGMIHPGAGFAMRRIGKLASMLNPGDEPFEPVRPNPAVAAKMRFGGPVDTSGGPAFPKVGMSGAPEAPTPGDAFQPNKVNPNIASRLRFGGPIDAQGGPSYGRVGMSGAPTVPPQTEPAAVPFQPNRVNPNIARGIRYTPGGDDAGGAAVSPSTVGTRAEMMRQLRLRQAANASPQITNPPIATPPATDAPTFANGGIKLNIRRR